MEKISIDDTTYVKVFKPDDFREGQTIERVTKHCEQIIKTHKGALDTNAEINNFWDETSRFFTNEESCLAFVLYSNIGCQSDIVRKATAFAYLSSETNSPKWNLELIYRKQDADSCFSRYLIKTILNYLKKLKVEELTVNVENKNKASLKFFEKLIDEKMIDGRIFKGDDIDLDEDEDEYEVEDKHGYNINDIEEEIDKDKNEEDSVAGVTEFSFNVKTYTPKDSIKEQIQE